MYTRIMLAQVLFGNRMEKRVEQTHYSLLGVFNNYCSLVTSEHSCGSYKQLDFSVFGYTTFI